MRDLAKEKGVPFYRQYSREQIGGETKPTIKTEVVEYLTESGKSFNIKTTGATDLRSQIQEESKAARMYDQIRKNDSDVVEISKNIGVDIEKVKEIKHHLFVQKHNIDGEMKPFDPSYEKAVSWRRLASGKNITKYDRLFIDHEILELELMSQGLTRAEAHKIATKRYNFNEAIERRGDKKW